MTDTRSEFSGAPEPIASSHGEGVLSQLSPLAAAVIDSSIDGILAFDLYCRYTVWNAGMERISGLPAAQVLGRVAFEVFPFLKEIGQEKHFSLALSGKSSSTEERGFNVPQTGQRGYFEGRYSPLRSPDGTIIGGLGVIRDTTERRRAEDEKRAADEQKLVMQAASSTHQQISEVLNRVSEGFLAVDQDWKVTFMNPEAIRFLQRIGRDPDEFIGRYLWDEFPELRGTALEENFLQAMKQQAPLHFEVFYEPIKIWFQMRVYPSSNGISVFFQDVTAGKRGAEALRESEEKFRLLADTIPQLAWMAGPDGSIFWYNRRWYEYTGATPAEMEGWGWQAVHDPEALPAVLARWRDSINSGQPFDMVFPLKGADGLFRPFLTRVNPLKDETGRIQYWFGTNTDISEQKRSEEASRFLADASAALAAVVDYESTLVKVAKLAVPSFAEWCQVEMAEPDGSLRLLAVAHADSAKLALARELKRKYPRRSKDLLGPPNVLRTGVPELVAHISDEMLIAAAQDDEHLQILRQLGLCSYISVPLSARGVRLGVLTFVRGNSAARFGAVELTLAEDLASRASVAIDNSRLYSELRQADRLKDEFLAMLAHELRNPLAPIRNALHIMKQPGADTSAMGKLRDLVERQVQHMARLLDDLVDVSRISQGRIELRKQSLDVAGVLERTIDACGPFFEERHHHLEVNIQPGPLWVEADPARLEQVLTNLLNNAAKYTDPGGLVSVSASREDDQIVLSVSDTGIGISADMLPRIFDLFVQAERRLDRSQGGVGIGLTLVKRLVEFHGGTIHARSSGLGQGSEFTVRLPAASSVAPQIARGESNAPEKQLPRRRVLVVDDNPDAADSLGLVMELAGQEVLVAYDGPEALARAEEFHPDLVLLDIGLPGMDGYEVARRLRKEGNSKGPMLVALTGWGQEEDRRRSREAGFDRHLVKPVEPAILEGLLEALRPVESPE